MKKENLFQQLLAEITTDFETESNLPVRLQILAKAFAGKWNTETVNRELLANDCEKLYARSYHEASLIYAFDNGISYEEWQKMLAECDKIYEEKSAFAGGKITLTQLKEYIDSESAGGMHTQYRTMLMEKSITEQKDETGFYDFMRDNAESFSSVREKARYYFCKYLYYYIQDKSDAYYKSCIITDQVRHQLGRDLSDDERGMQEKFALEDLGFLKPLTKLKKEADKVKPGMTPEEKREYLENTSLTPGGIFDEFNYFYFGYISTDWIEVLFELYGDFEEWPDHTKVRVAHSLGLCSSNPDEEEMNKALEELEKMAQEQQEKEEELDRLHSRDSEEKKKLYQRGRVGEDYFRDFILGKKDINRATLISFLLFVNTRISLDADNKITRNRLNRMLLNCGFPQLRPNNGFDVFVMNFLKAEDPMDILEEEVEKQVTKGDNCYLYQVYQDAYCHQKELLKYLV